VNVTTRRRSSGARTAASVILSMVVGLSACGEKGKQGTADSRPVVRDVEVVVVRPVPRETIAEAMGTVRARTTAAVAPQVMGRLTGVAVSEGSAVAAGALLATIDDTTVRAQLSSAEGAVAEAEAAREEVDGAISQAEAGKSLAEKTFERFRKLLEGRVVTQQEFDEVEMRRTVAVKDLERAQQKRAQVSAKIAQAKGQAAAARAKEANSVRRMMRRRMAESFPRCVLLDHGMPAHPPDEESNRQAHEHSEVDAQAEVAR